MRTMTHSANASHLNSKSAARSKRKLAELLALSVLSLLSASACVTVNVNLPEGAVQRAADDYVRELYRAKERNKASPSPEPSSKAASRSFSIKNLSLLALRLVPSAHAAEETQPAVFSLQTPKARAIQKKQKELAGEVVEQKQAGAIGEDKAGLLTLKDVAKLSAPRRIKVEKLVDKENALRRELYEEAQANATPSVPIETIQKSFAHSFQEYSPKGTWIQSEDGAWSRKP